MTVVVFIEEEEEESFIMVNERFGNVMRIHLESNILALWYKDLTVEDSENNLKMLKGDSDAIEMYRIAQIRSMVNLFVVHDVGDEEEFPECTTSTSLTVRKSMNMMVSLEKINSVSEVFTTVKDKGVVTSGLSDEERADNDELEVDHIIDEYEVEADGPEEDVDGGSECQVQTARNITFRKCDLLRVGAVCQKEYPFWLYSAFKEQYKRINDYCAKLLRGNLRSSVYLKVIRSPNFAQEVQNSSLVNYCVFQILYVCFDVCKKSFQHYRLFVGLDGCFLKTPQGRQLLTAIGRDPNDHMVPIAYEVVEVETKDSWGLLPAFEEVILGVNNRFCVRHLYNNFRKKVHDLELKKKNMKMFKGNILEGVGEQNQA
ncbi:hypothetical protein Ahy_B05g076381 [Arachis hypogaea]|uniref:MULE transposase domain-containing protein n=1 Tax=Arachis hypogaea TaxID=3818 RepID=A0A444Z354_ARAHY|nr:hypothetical protein Ahy_B05g076381 [Arachis hypogaea]